MTEAKLRETVELSLMGQALVLREVFTKIVIPESEIEQFYVQNGGVLPDWAEVEETARRRAQEKGAELADYKRIRKVQVVKEPLVRTSIGKVKRVVYKGALDEK